MENKKEPTVRMLIIKDMSDKNRELIEKVLRNIEDDLISENRTYDERDIKKAISLTIKEKDAEVKKAIEEKILKLGNLYYHTKSREYEFAIVKLQELLKKLGLEDRK